jgi:periplasmic glucans biosynthesis protein
VHCAGALRWPIGAGALRWAHWGRRVGAGASAPWAKKGVAALSVSVTHSCLVLATVLMASPGAYARTEPPPADKQQPAATYPFSLDTLLAEAKRRAATPYALQRSTLPAGLDKLSPEQYRNLRFNPDAGIWRTEQLPFRLELLRAGYNLQSAAVTVSTVENGMAQDVVATPAMFGMSTNPQLGKVSLPLSGFRLRTRINSRKVWDEFLVFQGASYYRAVARNLLYGLSARGLAINTAEPSGEEFPAFTHFWIERPAPQATSIVIYALLESDSTTGAYRFNVTPGVETVMDIEMTLFPRAEMRAVGIAPLTSMFLFDETNRGRLDDYRPEVHDSDGLQIISKTGEHIFRQLANPLKLQVSSFTTQAPEGFGLVQRSREQRDFEDFDNLYERRPSAWVEPKGDWGAGAVELVEIPSGRETNDNIVAFWRPAQSLNPGRSAEFAYRLTWLADPALPKSLGKVVATRSGASLDGKRRVFILDFIGAGEKTEGLHLDLGASTGKIVNTALMSNAALHGLRASFELDTSNAELIELRLRVMRGDHPVSETWLYRWTPS